MKGLTQMNCFHLKGAWMVAAALGLAFGLAASPAMADPRPHNHGGGGDEPATTFAVSLNKLISSDPVSGSEATQCVGTTDLQANPGLGANFPPVQEEEGCTVSVAIDDIDLVLRLFSLEVKVKKSGTKLRLYFTTQSFWAPHTEPLQSETIYVTDRLVASTMGNPNNFFLEPDGADALVLTKLHQPERVAVTYGLH